MADERELSRIRDALVEADDALAVALDARAKAVRRLAKLRNDEPEAYLRMPPRAEVVKRVLEGAKEFPPETVDRVVREVLGACDAMLAPVRVAVLGPEGGFAQVAALRELGASTHIEALGTVAQVFEDVERKRVEYGVVPLETSSEGAIAETIDALLASEARICAELTLPLTYDLVSSTGNQGDVESVYGTAAAVKACEATLERDLPKARVLDVKTGTYAEDLARDDHGAAALVAGWSESAPRGLRRIKARVEDRHGVDCRFVVVGHARPRRTGEDRTVIALAVGDDPGSLYRALQPFADRGINLSRIESRHARGASWRFIFILELEDHASSRAVVTAIDEVKRASRHLKVLGSFPRPASI